MREWNHEILTKHFFQTTDALEISAIDFSALNEMTSFVDFIQSDAGKHFLAQTKELVIRLKAWCDANAVEDSKALDQFAASYLDYDGQDSGLNIIYTSLYKQGIPALFQVEQLLINPHLPLQTRQDSAHNLMKALNVCAPGIMTNITNTYDELNARINLPAKWLNIRKQFLQQATVSILKEINTPLSYEIHYVNAVINHLGDYFTIPRIEDAFITTCDPEKVNHLLLKIEPNIEKLIQADQVILHLMNEINLIDLPTKLNALNAQYSDVIADFTQSLDQFGAETSAYEFYRLDEILDANDDYTQYGLSWKANDAIFLSLFARLQRADVMRMPTTQRILPINGMQLHFLPNHTLKFSYLIDDQNQIALPFVTHCVSMLLESNDTQALNQLLSELEATNDQRYEIIERYLQALNHEKKTLSNQLIETITSLLPDAAHWEVIINRLPMPLRERYLLHYTQQLAAMIKTPAQLILALESIPITKFRHFLNQFDHKELSIEMQMQAVLSVVPASKFYEVLRHVFPIEWPIISRSHEKWISLVTNLPSEKRLAFLQLIPSTKFSAVIENSSQLCRVLELLKTNERMDFLRSVDTHFLEDLITKSHELIFLELIPKNERVDAVNIIKNRIPVLITHWHDLAVILQLLPSVDYHVIISNYPTPLLRCIFQYAFQVWQAMKYIPIHERMAFLQALPKPVLFDLINCSNDLLGVLQSLQPKDVLPFIEQLNPKIFRTIITDEFDLSSMFFALPTDAYDDFIHGAHHIHIQQLLKTKLVSILTETVEEERIHILLALEKDQLEMIISSWSVCFDVLSQLPGSDVEQFLDYFSRDRLLLLINNAAELTSIIKLIPESTRYLYLQTLPIASIRSHLQNAQQLSLLLNVLSVTERDRFIDKLDTDSFISSLLQEAEEPGEALHEFVSCLSDAKREKFIVHYLSASTKQAAIPSSKTFISLLLLIRKEDRLLMIMHLPNELLHAIFIQERNMKEILRDLQCYKCDAELYRVLMIGILRAYTNRHTAKNSKQLSTMFSRSPGTKVAVANKAEQHLLAGETLGFFGGLSRKEKQAANDGDLGKIISEITPPTQVGGR